MYDPRIDIIAEHVADFSVNVQPGEKVLLDLWDEAYDFGEALIKAVEKRGGRPFLNLQNMRLMRSWIEAGDEEAFEAWYRYEENRMREMDGYVVVRKQYNNSEWAGIPADKQALYTKYHGKLHYGTRLVKTKWNVLRYPSEAMAQAAGMGSKEFEDFYFRACCLDYRRFNELVKPFTARMVKADQVHIVAPGTDLTFSVKGCRKHNTFCGGFNVPDGEMGMPIVQGTANGTISYNLPSVFHGIVFSNIRFTLKDGVIVKAESDHTKELNEILDIDPGARRIGEFSMGFNPFITRPILDTLFDEKMAQSIHFTPGNSNNNPSSIHWDIVASHSAENGGGEIWVDGELIRKDGLFQTEDLIPLNPEPLRKTLDPGF